MNQPTYSDHASNSQFTTYDLGAASALICVGFSLLRLDKENPRKCLFVFSQADGLQEALDRYWADELHGNLRKYFETVKMLKNRIYSEGDAVHRRTD